MPTTIFPIFAKKTGIMTQRKPLFLDTEFTGLQQSAQLISIALVEDEHSWFYAEFDDYDPLLLSDWQHEHVLPYLHFGQGGADIQPGTDCVMLHGDTVTIAVALDTWLRRFGPVEVWADVPAYDWVLFCQLFGGALQVPDNVFYVVYDFATVLRTHGLDPDADRLALAGLPPGTIRHNALNDALILCRCHNHFYTQKKIS